MLISISLIDLFFK